MCGCRRRGSGDVVGGGVGDGGGEGEGGVWGGCVVV